MRPGVMPGVGCEIVTLKNGTRAVRDRACGEVMHPGTGPQVESQMIYIRPSRLDARLREGGETLVVFDVGLGAASNAIAAWEVSEALGAGARRLEIVSFENNLDAATLALSEEHKSALGFSERARSAAKELLAAKKVESLRTTWRLHVGDFRTALQAEPDQSADIVYWDMFSPRTSPDLWTVHAFQKLYAKCASRATLHTYSASTSTRTALLLAGFAVGVGDQTGDKAETTIAAMRVEDLAAPLGDRWLQRLLRSSAPFSTDVDAADHTSTLEQIRSNPQFSESALGGAR